MYNLLVRNQQLPTYFCNYHLGLIYNVTCKRVLIKKYYMLKYRKKSQSNKG